jgi:uncharacterized protein YbjT (DUF2867 family)
VSRAPILGITGAIGRATVARLLARAREASLTSRDPLLDDDAAAYSGSRG